jgi:hypothetical protein
VRRAIITLSVIALLASPVRGALPIRIDLTPSGDTLDQGSDPYSLPLAHLSVSADGLFVTIGPYVRELATGAIDRYAIDVDGTPITAFGAGESNIISADGRYVLFLGTQYYPVPRLLLRDRLLQQTVELPIGVGGPIVGYVFGVQLSSDGGLVTFHANGTNLPGDAPYAQVYAHDIVSGVTELVSVPAGGGTPNGESYWADPSDDGQYVLFLSEASNLVLGVSGSQLYIRDRLAGTTDLVSRNSSGEPSTGTYGSARVSTDGRWVAFSSGGGQPRSRVRQRGRRHVSARQGNGGDGVRECLDDGRTRGWVDVPPRRRAGWRARPLRGAGGEQSRGGGPAAGGPLCPRPGCGHHRPPPPHADRRGLRALGHLRTVGQDPHAPRS